MGNCQTNEKSIFTANKLICSICKKEINPVFDICFCCSVCSKNYHHHCLEKKIPRKDRCYNCGNSDISYLDATSNSRKSGSLTGSLSFKSI